MKIGDKRCKKRIFHLFIIDFLLNFPIVDVTCLLGITVEDNVLILNAYLTVLRHSISLLMVSCYLHVVLDLLFCMGF